MLEQVKNGFVSEPINEAADQQNDTGLKNVLSGKNGGAYANQWNQLISDYESKKGVAGTYTVMIKHDYKTDMVKLQYQIGADKKPVKGSIKLAATTDSTTTTATTAQTAVSQSAKDSAQKIWVALEGSLYGEDEESVYAVFRDNITTDADLQSLITYWNSLKIPFIQGGATTYDRGSLQNTAKTYANSKPNTLNYPLQFWLTSLLSSAEINKINDYISKYSQFRFKTA